jgi:hypothetical protein
MLEILVVCATPVLVTGISVVFVLFVVLPRWDEKEPNESAGSCTSVRQPRRTVSSWAATTHGSSRQ